MDDSSAPTDAECSTRCRMVSAFCPPTAALSTGSTPLAATSRLAMRLTHTSSGLNTQMNAREGSPISRAARSGAAITHDLGAISPTTRCRNVTSSSDRMNAAVSAIPPGTPSEPSAGPSHASTAGLVTAPSAKVQAVMPSCAPANMTVSSSIPRMAARAEALRSASTSSRCLRAPSRENSIMTKNALATIRARVTTTTTPGLLIVNGPPRRRIHLGRRARLEDRSCRGRRCCGRPGHRGRRCRRRHGCGRHRCCRLC